MLLTLRKRIAYLYSRPALPVSANILRLTTEDVLADQQYNLDQLSASLTALIASVVASTTQKISMYPNTSGNSAIGTLSVSGRTYTVPEQQGYKNAQITVTQSGVTKVQGASVEGGYIQASPINATNYASFTLNAAADPTDIIVAVYYI